MASKKKKKPTVTPPSQPRTRQAILLCALATFGLLIADLGTKQWAESALSQEPFVEPGPICQPDEQGRITMQRVRTEPVVVVDGYLEFRYAENCGAAFGLMRTAPLVARKVVFGIAALLASVALFVMFVRGRGGTLFAVSVPLIVSGALGNLVDRLRYGYVVDFIRFHWQEGWEYPTFNIADVGITVGVILLVLDGFRDAREAKRSEQAKKVPSSSESEKKAEPEAS